MLLGSVGGTRGQAWHALFTAHQPGNKYEMN